MITKVFRTLHPEIPLGRARPANLTEILAHRVLGDRVSERAIDQFRAAVQQQGLSDISGRQRARSEAEAKDLDHELEQLPVRARPPPAVLSEATELVRQAPEVGSEVRRTKSIEYRGCSHLPEPEPSPLEDSWVRRNAGGTPDPGVKRFWILRNQGVTHVGNRI